MSGSRILTFIIREFKEIIPPTVFFAVSFNIIVLTTQLVLDDYRLQFLNFMVATTAALVVGKAVLVADALPFLNRFNGAPLIVPILFKTAVYFSVVFLVRFLEKIVEYWIGEGTLAGLGTHLRETFSWHRFAAIQIWIFVLFLIYVTATEVSALFRDGELAELFFKRRRFERRAITRHEGS
jgi:hypothetical protein